MFIKMLTEINDSVCMHEEAVIGWKWLLIRIGLSA